MTIGEISIKFEFDAKKTDDDKISYDVYCRTYNKGVKTHEHKVADAVRELGLGLFVFPLADNIHKSVRDAFVRRSGADLKTKAKWTGNGFLFKESE